MTDPGVTLAHLHVRLGLGDRLVVEQECVAAHEGLGAASLGVNVHLAPVGGDATVLEIDFDTMVEVVWGATWYILAPASWC